MTNKRSGNVFNDVFEPECIYFCISNIEASTM